MGILPLFFPLIVDLALLSWDIHYCGVNYDEEFVLEWVGIKFIILVKLVNNDYRRQEKAFGVWFVIGQL